VCYLTLFNDTDETQTGSLVTMRRRLDFDLQADPRHCSEADGNDPRGLEHRPASGPGGSVEDGRIKEGRALNWVETVSCTLRMGKRKLSVSLFRGHTLVCGPILQN